MRQGGRTAYIHIGPHKTGSTSLQAALFDAREQLGHAGYDYFDVSSNHSDFLAMAFWTEADAANYGKTQWIDDPAEFKMHREALRAKLGARIAATHGKHFILSGEELSRFRPQEVADLISFLRPSFDTIRVIAYAREPQSWMNSAAQQGVKGGGDVLEDILLSPRMPRFQERFETYIAAVGTENFDLRLYGASRDGFDVISDFSIAIGLNEKIRTSISQRNVNSAISHEATFMLSAVNRRHPLYVDYRFNPFRAYDFISEGYLPGRKFSLPTEVLTSVKPILEQEREWLNQRLGHHAFEVPELPKTSLSTWYGPDREALEALALGLAEKFKQAQNGKALMALIQAQRKRSKDLVSAQDDLNRAWILSTDQWSMAVIASEAVAMEHPSLRRFFAKQKLMRRIENPTPDDPALPVKHVMWTRV